MTDKSFVAASTDAVQVEISDEEEVDGEEIEDEEADEEADEEDEDLLAKLE